MVNPNDKRTPDDVANSIIQSAKSHRIASSRKMTYNDYEYYKSQLHSYSLYGYERQLADALGI